MSRLRLTLQYDGTAFSGWQRQPGARTVQSVLEDAVGRLLQHPERIPVAAAGRTDAGVHAEAMVVALDPPRALPLTAWSLGLNALLPDDLAVTDAAEVAPDFDPRRHALGKRYVYRIWNGPLRSPLRAGRAWHLRRPLDVPAMRAAAPHLLGTHDFTSFRGQGCTARHPVRRLDRVVITGAQGGELTLVFEGNAFLRHMVRNLAGTLVEVGRGRLPPEAVADILAARDRSVAGPTAPAHGLTLEKVAYPGDPLDPAFP